MSRSRPRVRSSWLGSVPYQEAWAHQLALVEAVRAGGREEILLLEHPHVFTLGRRAEESNVLWDAAERNRRQVELLRVDRGGDVTYHGPGQLVGYPILDLDRHQLDLLSYIRGLERALIGYLAEVGVEAGVIPGLTGVWTGSGADAAKVAAIGVKLTGERVTSHGFALNLGPDLGYFGGIVPCGITDHGVTSVRALTGVDLDLRAAADRMAWHLGAALDLEVESPLEAALINSPPS